jgi:hypothetical protein
MRYRKTLLRRIFINKYKGLSSKTRKCDGRNIYQFFREVTMLGLSTGIGPAFRLWYPLRSGVMRLKRSKDILSNIPISHLLTLAGK